MPRAKAKREPLYDGTFSVVTSVGETVLVTSDIFDALDLLRKQDPGAKMFRDGDKVLMAYTSGYKLPDVVKNLLA